MAESRGECKPATQWPFRVAGSSAMTKRHDRPRQPVAAGGQLPAMLANRGGVFATRLALIKRTAVRRTDMGLRLLGFLALGPGLGLGLPALADDGPVTPTDDALFRLDASSSGDCSIE
jgi:hypothetical protein